MGSFSSKQLEEVLKPAKGQETPKSQVLPFDPRSPSDYISRTPITVEKTSQNNDSTPRADKMVKVLALDPRSPNVEGCRTPILVESNEARRRHGALKPSKLAQLESNTSSSEADDTSDNDPRSPTNKVPRTPLEDKAHAFEDAENEEHNIETSGEDENTENVPVKKLFAEDTPEKPRRPLASVQNTAGTKTPRGLLQAKQCRNVEDEYNKNQQLILTQLSENQENTVASSTQFVESI